MSADGTSEQDLYMHQVVAGKKQRLANDDAFLRVGSSIQGWIGSAHFFPLGPLSVCEAALSPVQFDALERRYGKTLALLNFDSLCDFQCVVHLNAEITHRALHF